jgi:hypothetical protein
MSDILIPIVFFLTTAAAVIYFLYVRYKERSLMIEKGMAEFKPDIGKPNVLANLKWGILMISIALGLIFGYIIDGQVISQSSTAIIYIGSIFLFTGLGLLLYYFIASKKMNGDN